MVKCDVILNPPTPSLHNPGYASESCNPFLLVIFHDVNTSNFAGHIVFFPRVTSRSSCLSRNLIFCVKDVGNIVSTSRLKEKGWIPRPVGGVECSSIEIGKLIQSKWRSILECNDVDKSSRDFNNRRTFLASSSSNRLTIDRKFESVS